MNVDNCTLVELLLIRSWLGEVIDKEPRHLEKESIHGAYILIKKVDTSLVSKLLHNKDEEGQKHVVKRHG